ncbi:superinfection immunity protein [Chryseobacterium polytrichastri]|uniref:T4 immunity holin family protein n=1 Tax=Chryseobacterium polytrichastri TaxID=1302687 RepID=A0A1M7BSK9_9FLAO|nr:T4 immunity holin family protein [Chryseobacterium polytrichastri]
MLLLLSTAATKSDGSLFFKIILFVYFLPTIVGVLRIPIIKFKFITVLLINIFLGFTVVGWWLSFVKAVSNRKV